jgi:hypothetical protein
VHGRRWSKIATFLSGRTDNGVRNRWNRMERAQMMRQKRGADSGYRCRRCGQPKRGHICAALSTADGPIRGRELASKAAALTALSAQAVTAVAAGRQAGLRLEHFPSMGGQRFEGPPTPSSSASTPPLLPSPAEPVEDTAESESRAFASLVSDAAGASPLFEAELERFLVDLHIARRAAKGAGGAPPPGSPPGGSPLLTSTLAAINQGAPLYFGAPSVTSAAS